MVSSLSIASRKISCTSYLPHCTGLSNNIIEITDLRQDESIGCGIAKLKLNDVGDSASRRMTDG